MKKAYSKSLYYLYFDMNNKDFCLYLSAILLKNDLWQNILYFFSFCWDKLSCVPLIRR